MGLMGLVVGLLQNHVDPRASFSGVFFPFAEVLTKSLAQILQISRVFRWGLCFIEEYVEVLILVHGD